MKGFGFIPTELALVSVNFGFFEKHHNCAVLRRGRSVFYVGKCCLNLSNIYAQYHLHKNQMEFKACVFIKPSVTEFAFKLLL